MTTKQTKVNPVMPCGYDRTGIKLMARVRHYRVCQHPACQERLQAFEDMRGMFKAGLKDGSIKAGSR